MADNKKWSWIKLTPSFFDDYKIKLLQATDNGDSYLVFYIKLLAESSSHNGALRYSDEIPYDEKSLAVITNTNIDTVSAAIIKLQQLGLLSVFDNKTYFINRLYEHVGQDNSPDAKRKRKERYLSTAKEEKKAQLPNNSSKNNFTVREVSGNSPLEYKSNRVIEFKSNRVIDNTLSDKPTVDSSKIDSKFIEKVKEIVKYMNEVCKTSYRPTSKKTQTLIKARFNEGFEVLDFKRVLDIKSNQWLNDSKMEKFLRPETLFGTKFEGYLNEKENVQSKQNNVKKVYKNTNW